MTHSRLRLPPIPLILSFCLAGSCLGCDSGTSPPEPRDAGGPQDASRRDAGPRDAGPRDAGRQDAGARDAGPHDAGPRDAGGRDGGAPPPGLRIREVSPHSPDWIELQNTGTVALPLAGISVTDADGDVPHEGHRLRLPAELTLAPGERFVLVRAEPALEGLLEGAACDPPGVARCMHFDFGLSAGRGDSVFLEHGGRVFDTCRWGGDAVPDERSWCRVDTDAFEICTPTPGVPNARP